MVRFSKGGAGGHGNGKPQRAGQPKNKQKPSQGGSNSPNPSNNTPQNPPTTNATSSSPATNAPVVQTVTNNTTVGTRPVYVQANWLDNTYDYTGA